MPETDPFREIARYYDQIMDFVNYDRWFRIATSLAELLPADFTHLDAACGTGTLLRRLRRVGWQSFGIDLSPGMIRAGRSRGLIAPAAVADLRALPFKNSLDYVTCLFDSINFILDEQGLRDTFRGLATALRPGGILYFDIVTERMIKLHFENQEWTENNGAFSTTWRSSYSFKTKITETELRLTKGATGLFKERVYARHTLQAALKEAGFTLLGVFDAHTWKAPRKRSIRIDFIAAKNPSPDTKRRFKNLAQRISQSLN